MKVTIAGITFDHLVYDSAGDVLYLHVGEPRTAVAFDESPEGHAIRLDAKGSVIGLTLVRPRHLIELGKPVLITIPSHGASPIDPASLNSALHVA